MKIWRNFFIPILGLRRHVEARNIWRHFFILILGLRCQSREQKEWHGCRATKVSIFFSNFKNSRRIHSLRGPWTFSGSQRFGYKRRENFRAGSFLVMLVMGMLFYFWNGMLCGQMFCLKISNYFDLIKAKNGSRMDPCCSLWRRKFCTFERCLDSNPECCRSKQARYQLSHPSPLVTIATHLPYLATHLPYLVTHLPWFEFTIGSINNIFWQGVVGPGKFYYEATVTDEGLCRLGFSTLQASLGISLVQFQEETQIRSPMRKSSLKFWPSTSNRLWKKRWLKGGEGEIPYLYTVSGSWLYGIWVPG